MRKYFLWVSLSLISLAGTTQSPSTDKSTWEITVNSPENYIGIALSNGRIGMLTSPELFKASSIILNNVYDKESEYGVSKILKGINFAELQMTIDGDVVDAKSVTEWKQVLNMKEAFLETSFRFKNKATISYRIYAIRHMPYSGLVDVKVRPVNENIDLTVAGIITAPDNYKVLNSSFRILKDNEIRMPLLQTIAESQFGRHTLATTATFVFNHDIPVLTDKMLSANRCQVSFSKELLKDNEYNFTWAGAVCSTGDFDDPVTESERMVIYLMRSDISSVISEHTALWNELWEGDIIVENDPESQQDIRLALYHLYAFSRSDSRLSIPPMGLSSQIYNGHIFWDTELWMFPPVLVFHSDIASSILNYRFDRLEKARQKAANYGYKGAMFPWESDDTGEEATPSWALTGTFEHHITADVGIACWNYYRMTGDTSWLQAIGYPVIMEVADFWVSRSEINSDGSRTIRNVVGANEFAPNVDDNAFTNGSAKAVLEYAVKAANVLGIAAPAEWMETAGSLSFYHMPDGTMKEHKNYNNEIIKQADVNLLAYPLELIKDPAQIKRDLEYYEPRLSPEGPAMSHSVLSILYARLGDKKNAWKMFRKGYIPNRRPPFGAIAETPMFDNTYFTTGAGGMLQAVLFGFAGFHLTDEGIVQRNPCLPEHWKKITITGVGKEKKTYVITNDSL